MRRGSEDREPSGDGLRMPPNSIEAEEGLLAACLLEDGGEVIDECLSARVDESCFFREAHRTIFATLSAMRREEEPIDEVLLFERLRRDGKDGEVGGIEAIYALQERVETGLHARYFARIVIDKALLRRLIRGCRETLEAAYGQSEDPRVLAGKTEALCREIAEERDITAKGVRSADDVGGEELEKIIRRVNDPESVHENVCPTHLSDLNGMFDFGGFSPGEMIVVAARPSVGKSSLGANFAEFAAADRGIGTLYFNHEMVSGQTFTRILASRSRVGAKSLRKGELSSTEQQSVARAAKEIRSSPLFLDDRSSNTIVDIRTESIKKARELDRMGKRLGLIVIDYLQLIRAFDPRVPRIEQVGQISRGVKSLAKELLCPVVILSQLNRESVRQGRKPTMADLREAGDIEQDADVVMLLHRRTDTENEADQGVNPDVDHIEIIIDKQRDGATGVVDTTFVKRYTRFENFAR